MVAGLLCILLGAATFVGQEIPGVSVGPIRPFAGSATVNFRHIDLDRDGASDLLLPTAVLLQREGRFPMAGRVTLPTLDTPFQIDTWDDRLYFLASDRLSVLRWEVERWETVIEQAIDLPPGQGVAPEALSPTKPKGRLQQFLYDIDGDNIPEVVVVSVDGIHVFQLTGGKYVQAGVLDAIPELRLVRVQAQQLWPAQVRRTTLPARQASCRIKLDSGTLAVLTWREANFGGDQRRIVYQRKRYSLENVDGWAMKIDDIQPDTSAPMPDHLYPCRLNDDDVIDYAGFRWRMSRTSQFPMPLYETWATLDRGTSFFVRRNPALDAFRPQCAFVDFDGDGDLEMVTEATRLFVGGARETIGRLMAQQSLDHELRVYEQVQGDFAPSPRINATFSIRLKQPPFRGGEVFRRYQAGELLNITGDFNNDGYRDLVVRDAQDRLSIYIAAGFGYPAQPSTTLNIQPEAQFSVADINGDGRSDIVIRWYDPAGTSSVPAAGVGASGMFLGKEHNLVYLSEEEV